MAAVSQRQSQPAPNEGRQNMIDNIAQDLTDFLKGDRVAKNNLLDLFTTVFDRIGALEAKLEDQNVLIADQSEILDSMATKNRVLGRENELIKEEITVLRGYFATNEDATKLLYLRVEGIAEDNNSSLLSHVAQVLSDTGVICPEHEIDYVRRLGKFRAGKVRPVIVRFVREGMRNQVFFNRYNLNKGRRSQIWISDEVSDGTRRMRKVTRDVATLAKSKGHKNIKIHSDGIVYNNNKIRHTALDLLPADISVFKAKSRCDNEDLFFQSEVSPLSNFHPVIIIDDDETIFVNVEQAFQYKRAIYHHKLAEAAKILTTRNPYEIKSIANSLPNSKEWREQQTDVMYALLIKKFNQNELPRKFLIDTAGCHLHEASTDKFWAIGVDLSSKSLTTGDWKGTDKLGQLLEMARAEIVTKYGNDDRSSDSHIDLNASAGAACQDNTLNGSNNVVPTAACIPESGSTNTSETAHPPLTSPKPDQGLSTGLDHNSEIGTPSPTRGTDQLYPTFQLPGDSSLVTGRDYRRSHRSFSSSPNSPLTGSSEVNSRSSGYRLRKARDTVYTS